MSEEKTIELTEEALDSVAGGAEGHTTLRSLEEIEGSPIFGPLKDKLVSMKQQGMDADYERDRRRLLTGLSLTANNYDYSITGRSANQFINKYWPLV